ncbi:branched-chain amino acid transport system II carrier protein [Parendozoicomonas haliclonae]|uniref:Branched-chain amino acid transport system carrier protein n=1 Tax=Parendozoicomonas haliclonae TaxID=1960125 RepID=A0A1X7ANM5_9GAMM|nr:branched-chain amino acid transport system II carrier protein [Parendozoicomonas haliclonae]SMA49680.1 Branched-chain amino acid transport system 2 carrier protein [Parendozoicomonas haliclonae]
MGRGERIGIGLMVFAFFLGAGNLIFPPWAGQLSGENLWLSLTGFLLTDVGLSMLGIVAIALAGSPESLTRDIPGFLAPMFWIAAYVIIGPAFAVPRTSVVAFDVGIRPWLPGDEQSYLALYSIVFFAISAWLCIFPGRLITVVGRILTPVLLLVLLAIYIAMFLQPPVTFGPGLGPWANHAMLEGAVQGYQTMDTLGALAFGLVITSAVKNYGVTSRRELVRYTSEAAIIAGIALSVVYIGLFYLGGISRELIPDAANGGIILSYMVVYLLGDTGQAALTVVITLACLTTAVGVTTACGNYFHSRWPKISYRFWVIQISFLAMIVANAGLNTLLKLSVPVVLTIYPVAIMIISVELIRTWVVINREVVRASLLVVVIFSAVDGLYSTGLIDSWTFVRYIPLFENGLGWMLPGLSVLLAGWLFFLLKVRYALR